MRHPHAWAPLGGAASFLIAWWILVEASTGAGLEAARAQEDTDGNFAGGHRTAQSAGARQVGHVDSHDPYHIHGPNHLPLQSTARVGPASVAPNADTSKKLLVMRVYFNNYTATSRYTTAEAVALMEDMNDVWRQTSYDATEMDYAVTELYQVPGDDSDYVDWGTNFSTAAQMQQLLTDAVVAAPDGTDFTDLDGALVLMAETDTDNWHRGRAGTYSLPIGEEGKNVSVKSAIFVENPSDADDKVWGRWMHEIGHVFQVAGPAHPSKYDSNFELMDAAYPGQSGVFEKLATQGFPDWLPDWKYIAFTPDASIGTAGAGVGGGLASVWAIQYDPDDSPSAQAVRAFVTDSVYYLVSFRRRILGDDINSSFAPAGIPDEGVLIERVVEGGDPDSEDRWVTLQAPPGGDINDLWKCGQTYTNLGDGIEIKVGRDVTRELVVTAFADAWIREGDVVNHGNAQELYVGNFSNPEGGFDGRFRSIMQFSLDALPAGANVVSAALELRHAGVGGSQTVSVGAMNVLDPWAESTVTWANQPDSAATAAIEDVGTAAGLIDWDVTLQVKSWQAGTTNNNGLLLRAVSETANVIPRHFRSSEYLGLGLGGGSNSFAPKLRIVYTQSCPPEDTDPDRSYVQVSYDPGASMPDVHISPWRVPPLNDWESTDVWIDSPVNGYGTYRYGTWPSPYGDPVPYWNGDEPLVDSPNRVVARIRNVGTQNATNLTVHFDITDPAGLGINSDFASLGVVDSGDFPGLALIPPGGYTDVYVSYTPDVDLSEEDIEDGFFAFHTCLRIRVDAVAGETILGNQDGNEEQENMFWYEVPDDGQDGAPAPDPYEGAIRLKNFDPVNEREFVLYYEPDLPDGWSASVNGGDSVVTLAPAAVMDVPVSLVPPNPLPPTGSIAKLDVAASYIEVLENELLTGNHKEHREDRDLGGVTVVGAVVAKTDTHCVANRSGGQIQISGAVSAALGERPAGSVFIRPGAGGPLQPTVLAGLSRVDGTFSAVLPDTTGVIDRVDCLFGGTKRLGRSADSSVPVPPGTGRPTPTAPAPYVVSVVPSQSQTVPGDTITQTITYVGSPPDPALLDAIELDITFNPAIVRVVDADPAAGGVQMLPGGALDGFQVRQNTVDNVTGQAVLRALRATEVPISERVLLRVGFTALGAGSTPVDISHGLFSAPRGPLVMEFRDGVINVVTNPRLAPFDAVGRVRLEGRTVHSGAVICTDADCARSAASGDFTLPEVRVGETYTTTNPGYLTAWGRIPRAPTSLGDPVDLGLHELLAGDIYGDLDISLSDATAVLGAVGTTSGDRRFIAVRDLNRDAAINRTDVSLVAGNLGAKATPLEEVAGAGRVASGANGSRAGRVASGANGSRAGSVVGRVRDWSRAGSVGHGIDGGGFRVSRASSADSPMQAGLSVMVAPAGNQVVAGAPVTIEVRVASAVNLAAFDLEFGFDPRVATVRDLDVASPGVQVDIGSLFPSSGTVELVNTVDSANGLVRLAAGLEGEKPGLDGDGAIARIVLDTTQPGGSELRIRRLELRDDTYPDSLLLQPQAVAHGVLDVVAVPTAAPTATATPGLGTPSVTPGTPDTPEPSQTPISGTPPTPMETAASPTATATPGSRTPEATVSATASREATDVAGGHTIFLPRTLRERSVGALAGLTRRSAR